MLPSTYPTTTKTTRMGKRRKTEGTKENNMETGIQNLLKHIERKERIPEEEQKENIKRILKGINYKWGEMSCPAEAYQLIMEKRKGTAMR